MPFEFAAAKKLLRRTVHKTFGLDATYESKYLSAPMPLRVRWHNKLTDIGDIESQGYPVSIDAIDKVVFDREDLAARGIVISKGGVVTITAEGFGGQRLAIDKRDPRCGPTEEIWHVSKVANVNQPP